MDFKLKTANLDKIMQDIISLVPQESATPQQLMTLLSLAEQMSIVAGAVAAMQKTAGRVFAACREGNTTGPDAFYEVLTSIEVDTQ